MGTIPVINVAIADEQLLMQQGIMALLGSRPDINITIQATNGQDLITRLHAAATPPHICIIDLKMPVMNGHQAAAYVSQNWPRTGIIALTAIQFGFHITKAVRCGVRAYLLKSCGADELYSAILSVHRYGCYYSKQLPQNLLNEILDNTIKNPQLTESENAVMQEIATGRSYEEIAKKLKITVSALEGARERLFRKLRVTNKLELCMAAFYINYPDMQEI